MKQILNTIFLKDCIENIDIRYKELVKEDLETYFLYANILELPLYYNLFTFRKNPDYNLYNKLHNNKIKETVFFIIEKIKEENYDNKLVFFLYSYICNIYLKRNIETYINHKSKTFKFTSKKRKMNKYSKVSKYIEAQFYEDRFGHKIKKFKINYKALSIDEKSLKLIENITKEIYLFSFGIDLINIGYKNFKKFHKKHNLINKVKFKLLDIFTKSKLYSASSIYIKKTPKKDYLNKENNVWINNGKESIDSFSDIYQKSIKEVVTLLNLLSDKIYYNSKCDKEIEKLLF